MHTRLVSGLAFLLTVVSASSTAQATRTIIGTVEMIRARTGVENAQVHIFGTNYGTFTKQTGYFRIEGVPTDTVRIVIKRQGFAPFDTLLAAGGDLRVSLYLETAQPMSLDATRRYTAPIRVRGSRGGSTVVRADTSRTRESR